MLSARHFYFVIAFSFQHNHQVCQKQVPCFKILTLTIVAPVLPLSHGLLAPTMDRVLANLETKLLRLGDDFKPFWFVTAAYSLSLMQIVPETDPNRQQPHTIDAISRLYHKILAMQDPNVKVQILEEQKRRQAAGGGIVPRSQDDVDLTAFGMLPSPRSVQTGPSPTSAISGPHHSHGQGQYMEFPELDQWMMHGYSGSLDPTL